MNHDTLFFMVMEHLAMTIVNLIGLYFVLKLVFEVPARHLAELYQIRSNIWSVSNNIERLHGQLGCFLTKMKRRRIVVDAVPAEQNHKSEAQGTRP